MSLADIAMARFRPVSSENCRLAQNPGGKSTNVCACLYREQREGASARTVAGSTRRDPQVLPTRLVGQLCRRALCRRAAAPSGTSPSRRHGIGRACSGGGRRLAAAISPAAEASDDFAICEI
jgi:hypothetical protein